MNHILILEDLLNLEILRLPPSRKENSPESLGAHMTCLNYCFWSEIPQIAREQRWEVCCVCLFVCFIWRGKNVSFICWVWFFQVLRLSAILCATQVFSNLYSLHESCIDKFCCLQIRSQMQGCVNTLTVGAMSDTSAIISTKSDRSCALVRKTYI